jgi:hypothetical protein
LSAINRLCDNVEDQVRKLQDFFVGLLSGLCGNIRDTFSHVASPHRHNLFSPLAVSKSNLIRLPYPTHPQRPKEPDFNVIEDALGLALSPAHARPNLGLAASTKDGATTAHPGSISHSSARNPAIPAPRASVHPP